MPSPATLRLQVDPEIRRLLAIIGHFHTRSLNWEVRWALIEYLRKYRRWPELDPVSRQQMDAWDQHLDDHWEFHEWAVEHGRWGARQIRREDTPSPTNPHPLTRRTP